MKQKYCGKIFKWANKKQWLTMDQYFKKLFQKASKSMNKIKQK